METTQAGSTPFAAIAEGDVVSFQTEAMARKGLGEAVGTVVKTGTTSLELCDGKGGTFRVTSLDYVRLVSGGTEVAEPVTTPTVPAVGTTPQPEPETDLRRSFVGAANSAVESGKTVREAVDAANQACGTNIGVSSYYALRKQFGLLPSAATNASLAADLLGCDRPADVMGPENDAPATMKGCKVSIPARDALLHCVPCAVCQRDVDLRTNPYTITVDGTQRVYCDVHTPKAACNDPERVADEPIREVPAAIPGYCSECGGKDAEIERLTTLAEGLVDERDKAVGELAAKDAKIADLTEQWSTSLTEMYKQTDACAAKDIEIERLKIACADGIMYNDRADAKYVELNRANAKLAAELAALRAITAANRTPVEPIDQVRYFAGRLAVSTGNARRELDDALAGARRALGIETLRDREQAAARVMEALSDPEDGSAGHKPGAALCPLCGRGVVPPGGGPVPVCESCTVYAERDALRAELAKTRANIAELEGENERLTHLWHDMVERANVATSELDAVLKDRDAIQRARNDLWDTKCELETAILKAREALLTPGTEWAYGVPACDELLAGAMPVAAATDERKEGVAR